MENPHPTGHYSKFKINMEETVLIITVLTVNCENFKDVEKTEIYLSFQNYNNHFVSA